MSYWIRLDELNLDFTCDARRKVLECMMGAGKNGTPVPRLGVVVVAVESARSKW
ncbi:MULTISPECIES: hypothetical protein [Marinobacter]|jgi:hypothetical protein|uniref:hypothetical protein n=1 Tax=Marinobacter TaxID=2742 RepID=UPI001D0D6A84|nr:MULTISPECIES: hypothetical protein [unclassified Marinobacter]